MNASPALSPRPLLRLISGDGASFVREAAPSLAPLRLVSGLPPRAIVDELLRGQRIGDTAARAMAFYMAELADCTGWKELGSPTLAHFALHQLDMYRRRAGELLAVGLMLRDHPTIDDAFRQGGLAWSKLIELAKVVSPAHEQAWLARALASNLGDLKKAIRNAKPGGWGI